MINHISITRQNSARRNKYFLKPYNPHTGLGSTSVPRKEVKFRDLTGALYLPEDMLEDTFVKAVILAGSFHAYAYTHKIDFSKVLTIFNRIRFEHDFEYWAITTIKIQDKISLKEIPFLLRYPQRILLGELEKMRRAGVPIRMIILKARQWGGSTLVQMYMSWIQQIHKKNWHLAVVAQDDGAANNISELYKRASVSYPKEIATITYKPYARSPKNSVNVERGGIVGIGSINNPNQFRSYNYPMIHASEPGVWEDTPRRTGKALMTSLRSSVPKEPYTVIVLESTAKGVGSFFHDEWLKAEKGSSGYAPVFVPWFHISIYTEKMEGKYADFIDTMTKEDWLRWELGATLEGIKWYREYKKSENFDDWMMNNEFPSTPEEAFIASGTMYFEPSMLKKIKGDLVKPIGRYAVQPESCENKQQIKESSLVLTPRGAVSVWGLPKLQVTIKGKKYDIINRYVAAADIGGTTKEADFSVLSILDRYWMLFGGHPTVAATYRLHLHQDLFAWKCVQLAKMYGNALLAFETNSLVKEKASGDHFLTILDTIKDHYSNLYIRNPFDATNKDWLPKYGFHTNSSSKDMILSALRKGLREETFTEPEMAAYEEYGFFERKPDGSLGAIGGKHDDILITRALAYWLATSPQGAPPVQLLEVKDEAQRRKQRHSPMGVI